MAIMLAKNKPRKSLSEAREMAKWLKESACYSYRELVFSSQHPYWHLTTVYTSRSRGSDTWPLWAHTC